MKKPRKIEDADIQLAEQANAKLQKLAAEQKKKTKEEVLQELWAIQKKLAHLATIETSLNDEQDTIENLSERLELLILNNFENGN